MKNGRYPENLIVRTGIQGLGVFTTEPVKKGQTIFVMQGEVIHQPTRTSVQIGEKKHIEDELAGFLNHNCQPTAKVDRDRHSFVSLRDLKEGDEITFNYNANEDHLAAPFKCHCCQEKIQGKHHAITGEDQHREPRKLPTV